jgi:hypothetical protein
MADPALAASVLPMPGEEFDIPAFLGDVKGPAGDAMAGRASRAVRLQHRTSARYSNRLVSPFRATL